MQPGRIFSLANKLAVRGGKLLLIEGLRVAARGHSRFDLSQDVVRLMGRIAPRNEALTRQAVKDFRFVVRYLVLKKPDGLGFLRKLLADANATKRMAGASRPRGSLPGRPRILYVTGMFPSLSHAGGLRLFDILELLAKTYEVDLFTAYEPEDDAEAFKLLAPQLNQTRLVSHETFHTSALLDWLIERKIEFGHYDVIQFEYPNSAYMIQPAKIWARRVGFTLMENVTKRDFMSYEAAQTRKGFAGFRARIKSLFNLIQAAAVESVAIRSSDFSIAVTPDDATFAERVVGIRPDVVSTGISNYAVYNRIATEAVPPQPESLMFLGYYDHLPNVEAMQWYLRDVHPLIKAKLPDVKVDVVGAGDLSPLKAEFGQDSSIEFVGRVDSFIPSIAKAKVCISPLVSGAGFRGKINQYSAVGRPTVTTSIGVSGQPYVHGESVFVADDAERFSQYVIDLLTNEEKWKSVSDAAEKTARDNFAWSAKIKQMEAIYAQ